MHSTMGTLNRVFGRTGVTWQASIHNGLDRRVAEGNGVRRSGGRVHGAEEISPLRVSVLRIAVRQAHTSNALIRPCPTLSGALVWGVGLGRRRPGRRRETGTEVREMESNVGSERCGH
jgi:hypothetical protein